MAQNISKLDGIHTLLERGFQSQFIRSFHDLVALLYLLVQKQPRENI